MPGSFKSLLEVKLRDLDLRTFTLKLARAFGAIDRVDREGFALCLVYLSLISFASKMLTNRHYCDI